MRVRPPIAIAALAMCGVVFSVGANHAPLGATTDPATSERETSEPPAPSHIPAPPFAPDSGDQLLGGTLPRLPDGFVLPSEEDATLIPEIETNHSVTDPESMWVMVNKEVALDPVDFEPQNMRIPAMNIMTDNYLLIDEAATALEAMNAAVKEDTGHSLVMLSAYRSYEYQERLYDRFTRQHGPSYADKISARAGHSEHQTGWAVDVGQSGNSCITQMCFGDTPAGVWIAKNSWKHGFIIRYPQDGTEVTGFSYEPWHLRYVGPELAEYMHINQIATLEEALQISAED